MMYFEELSLVVVSSQAKPYRCFLSGPHGCKTRGQCRQSTWSAPTSSSSSFSASSSSSFSTLPSSFPSKAFQMFSIRSTWMQNTRTMQAIYLERALIFLLFSLLILFFLHLALILPKLWLDSLVEVNQAIK